MNASREINLVFGQRKKISRFYRWKKIVETVVIFLNVVLVLVMGAIFFIFSQSNNKVKTDRRKLSLLNEELKKQEQKERYLLTIDNRAGEIESILKTRVSQARMLAEIKTIFVPGFFLSSLETKSSKLSALSGVCLNTQCVSNLNEKVEELKEKGFFSRLSYPAVSRKDSASPYEIRIEIQR